MNFVLTFNKQRLRTEDDIPYMLDWIESHLKYRDCGMNDPEARKRVVERLFMIAKENGLSFDVVLKSKAE